MHEMLFDMPTKFHNAVAYLNKLVEMMDLEHPEIFRIKYKIEHLLADGERI